MASRTFCTQALTNTGHLFIWTFQRINCPLVRTVVACWTWKACGLMVLIVESSRFTFKFKPKSFWAKGTAIATEGLDGASVTIVPRRTDERLGHDLMWTIETRFTRNAFIRWIVAPSISPCPTLNYQLDLIQIERLGCWGPQHRKTLVGTGWYSGTYRLRSTINAIIAAGANELSSWIVKKWENHKNRNHFWKTIPFNLISSTHSFI